MMTRCPTSPLSKNEQKEVQVEIRLSLTRIIHYV